jgi:hypothetical protein
MPWQSICALGLAAMFPGSNQNERNSDRDGALGSDFGDEIAVASAARLGNISQ